MWQPIKEKFLEEFRRIAAQDSKTIIGNARKLLRLTAWLTALGSVLLVLALRFVPVRDTLFMRILSKKNNAQTVQEWVPLSQISYEMQLAVVASEDNTFTQHHGFCLEAIATAWENNQQGKKMRGGSTISQQTAKNAFLNNDRTYLRKALEAYFTVLIESLWGKERIMEVYLNVIELGPGLYGVEAASQKYFHHSAKSLSRSEAALLATVLPNPIKMKVDKPSPYVRKRSAKIAELMSKMKFSLEK